MFDRALERLLPYRSRYGSAVRRALGQSHRGEVRVALRRWAKRHPNVTFLQIGSYDGAQGDPLYPYIDRYGWSGVLVEANPTAFALLRELRGSDLRFELHNVAVTDHRGQVALTVTHPDPGMPDWAAELSTLHPHVIDAHPQVAGMRTSTIDVPAVVLDDVLPERFDVLHVDTEGHDAVILDQLDLSRAWPSVVLFEEKHLAYADRLRCRTRLEGAGFRVWHDRNDMLGIR